MFGTIAKISTAFFFFFLSLFGLGPKEDTTVTSTATTTTVVPTPVQAPSAPAEPAPAPQFVAPEIGAGLGYALSESATTGSTPLTVHFSGTINPGTSCSLGKYVFYFDDGQSTVLACTDLVPSPHHFSTTHTYITGGTFDPHIDTQVDATHIARDHFNPIQVTATVSSIGVSVSLETATFTVTLNGDNSCSPFVYTLDYGDGTPPRIWHGVSSSCSATTVSVTHIYSGKGTYPVTLSSGSAIIATKSVVVAR